MQAMFERLRTLRVSPHKRGADLPATVHGPLTGVVPGAAVALIFARRCLKVSVAPIANPAFARRRDVLKALPVTQVRFARRRLAVAPVVLAGARFETRWPTVAGTPFEFTPRAASGRVTIRDAARLRFDQESAMTRQEMLALKGAFVTIEGQRREIRDVHILDDGSCDLTIHPPVPLAAPVEVFEPLDIKGAAEIVADNRVRFTPDA